MPEALKKANLDHWDSKDSFTKDELAYLLLDLEPQYEGSQPVVVDKIINIIQHAGLVFGGTNSDKNNNYPRKNIRNWAVRCGILELIPFLQTRKERNGLNRLAQDFGLPHDDEKVFIHYGSAIKIINQIPINFSKEDVREFPDLTGDDVTQIPHGYIQTDNPFIYKHPSHMGANNPFISRKTRKVNPGLEVNNKDEETQEGTIGVTVNLPHTTKALEVVFKAMWKYWGEYDPQKSTDKELQKNIRSYIASGLEKEYGTPTATVRDALVLAKNIRPDPIREKKETNQEG